MSVHVMSWVLRNSEEKLANRLVLLVLADHASEDGGDSYPAVETIAREARVDRRTAQRCLRALEESGAIEVEQERGNGVRAYRVLMAEEGRQSAAPGAASTTDEGRHTAARTVLSEPSIEPSTSQTLARLAPVPPSTINGKRVTEHEAAMASEVLAIWNELAGQELRSRDWLAKIISRCREYPEATADDHRVIIATALAHPWWKGAASPSVVYGSGAQFERSIQAVRSARTSDERFARLIQAGVERGRRTA